MLRITNILLLFCLLASLFSACQSAAPPPAPTAEPATATPLPPTATPPPPTATAEPTPVAAAPAADPQMTVLADQITSAALAGNLFGDPTTRPFYVLLPPGYASSDQRYPVVYVLHGWFDSEASMVGKFKTVAEQLLREGAIQEMIFVFPNADNLLHGSMYQSSPTIGDYETYLTQELVGLVDSKYRTLAQRESRGVTGCSMGGDGAIHLALKYPQVYSVAAPVSATYDETQDPVFAQAAEYFRREPANLDDLGQMNLVVQVSAAMAAAAAASPDQPPFYFDMPLTLVDGKGQVVPAVLDKIADADPTRDLAHYVAQPERLRAILIYHGAWDPVVPVELAQAFSARLTEQGIEHEYGEARALHCDEAPAGLYTPVIQFMADNLGFAE